MKTLLHTVFGVVLMGFILTGTPAFATPTLQIDGSGQLTGATEVDVAGTLYDVTFVDGTCTAIFNGCDATNDFEFQTQTGATAAAQALLDHVFIDNPNFSSLLPDSRPERTTGCESLFRCNVLIPFHFSPGSIRTAVAQNYSVESFDVASNQSPIHPSGTDTTRYATWVHADFTRSSAPITSTPEPGTMILLSTGLLGLAGYRWQQRRREGSQVG